MAEGFEPYHVPQQSRRDKLRENSQLPPAGHGCLDSNLQACAALLPFYDPSLVSSDLINCAANLHRETYGLSAGVKGEGMNLMGFMGGMSATHMYVDPQLSVQLNPSSIQDINGNPCVYNGYRGVLDQSFHGSEAVAVAVAHHPHQEHNSGSGGGTTSGQSLSLSLSSHHSNLPLELNLQRCDESPVFGDNKVSGGYVVSCSTKDGFTSIELSKSPVPLGPFTGYASVLKGSRFLKPAQQLLEELCDVGRGFYADKNGPGSALLDPPPPLGESLSENGIVDDSLNCSDGGDQTRKKSRLLSMLDEVYKRYKQYYQQMQAAVAAFESVAGLTTAAPFANLALKALSKHFRCLKNAITDQLHFTSKSHGKMNYERDEAQKPENLARGTYGQRPFHIDQPVWRPQRGLPEHAVTVLRAWLFEHFLHPYPTDTDKLMLAKQTGLSRNQVSNWFINARVRLWKPMVEEIHMLETHQSQKASSQREEHQQPLNALNNNHHLPTGCAIDCENNASTSSQRIGPEFTLKRTRMDATESDGLMRSPYDGHVFHNPQHSRVAAGGNNGGVSLTLGLHQNSVGLSETYPIHAARRLGLDSSGEGYVVSGFAAQNRQFGRDIMEGQIMHEFVG